MLLFCVVVVIVVVVLFLICHKSTLAIITSSADSLLIFSEMRHNQLVKFFVNYDIGAIHTFVLILHRFVNDIEFKHGICILALIFFVSQSSVFHFLFLTNFWAFIFRFLTTQGVKRKHRA